jgi:hypothetical protein
MSLEKLVVIPKQSIHFWRCALSAVVLMCVFSVKAQPVNSVNMDPHLWLEEVQGDKALAWVRERNAVSTALLQAQPVFADNRAKVLGVLNNRDQIPGVSRRGEYLYNFWRDEKNPRGLWRRTYLEEYRKVLPTWDVLLDLDALGKAPELVEAFFISLKPERKGTGVNVKSADGQVTVMKGLPALKKYRASLTFLFTENCVAPSLEYQLVMTRFFKGLGNIDASDKTKPKDKATGKEPLSYPLYLDILKAYADKSHCFMMLFFITTWNLICRGKQTSEITLSQLSVVNDAVTIEFSGTKTDTDGQTSNTKEPRHCYANPHNWRTCFVTWLGIGFKKA